MTPTLEQLAIIAAAQTTRDNLQVRALAGAAKTSTLVLIAQALPAERLLCLAFNKKIAEEMKQRLPGNCEAKTLHSLGLSAWRDYIGKFPKINTGKCSQLFKRIVDGLSPAEREEAWALRGEILDAVGYGKGRGWVPGSVKGASPLISDEEIYAVLEFEPTPLSWTLIQRISERSVAAARDGEIDFDDMILLPVIFPCSFDRYDVVLVDEAQDLSTLNHALLRKLRAPRIIAVGDPCQAIYGFRGAHEESMDVLRESFQMRVLTLSISFRCPQAVVREAQWRAPHMQWPDWAKPGSVRHLPSWTVEDLPENCAILCRNNAPIFAMGLALIANGRFPTIPRSDIGGALLKQLEKLGPKELSQANALIRLEEWEAAQRKRARNLATLNDRVACLRIFIEAGDDLGQAIAYAKRLLEASGTIEMSTIHRSKGLEWDDVFILDESLISTREQDPNLRYVAQTRSKLNLTYITTEGFHAVS